MTKTAVLQLCSEAITLDDEIKVRSQRLKDIKNILIEQAGKTDTIHEVGESKIRIQFPKPSLRSKLSADLLEKVKALAGRSFKKLFVSSFKPVSNKFREEAYRLLEKEEAKKLVGLLEEESSPRVVIE